MKIWPWILGFGVVGVGVATIALASGGGGPSDKGISWTGDCQVAGINAAELTEWLNANVVRIVRDNNVTTGRQFIDDMMSELAPENCKDRIPPLPGTVEYVDYSATVEALEGQFQTLVNAIRAQLAGASLALATDPAEDAADAMVAAFGSA